MPNNNDHDNSIWKTLADKLSGVAVVITALIVLSLMTGYLVSAVNSDDAKLAIATTALGVIGTVTGAFFGVKVANDSRAESAEATKEARTEVSDANAKLVAVAQASDPNDPGSKRALGVQ